MFEGTGYAIAEIVWWMTAASVLGAAIGWILHRFFVARRHLRDLEHARQRIADLETRLSERQEHTEIPDAPDAERSPSDD